VAGCQHRGGQLAWTSAAGQPQRLAAAAVVDAKLRRFYAYWCLREAYVKMTGEALLADWLRRLEFRDVAAPAPAPAAVDNAALLPGEVVTAIDVYLDDRRVAGVAMELRALGRDYMVATAVRPRGHGDGDGDGVAFTGFATLDFARDIAALHLRSGANRPPSPVSQRQ
jgi:4'-phosphopantetheinyl transferase